MTTAATDTVLHRWLAALDAGRFDELGEYVHDDLRLHAPMGLSCDGVAAFTELIQTVMRAFPDMRHDVQEVIDAGDTLAARVIVTGTHQGAWAGVAPTNNAVSIDQALFVRVTEGKIAEVWEIVDSASMLQQVGAIPTNPA